MSIANAVLAYEKATKPKSLTLNSSEDDEEDDDDEPLLANHEPSINGEDNVSMYFVAFFGMFEII